jgi:hypothetical protein
VHVVALKGVTLLQEADNESREAVMREKDQSTAHQLLGYSPVGKMLFRHRHSELNAPSPFSDFQALYSEPIIYLDLLLSQLLPHFPLRSPLRLQPAHLSDRVPQVRYRVLMQQPEYNVQVVVCTHQVPLLGHAAADFLQLNVVYGLELSHARDHVHVLEVYLGLDLVRLVYSYYFIYYLRLMFSLLLLR